jgi:hypothetical protein
MPMTCRMCGWRRAVHEHRYRITISGALGRVSCQLFDDFVIEPADGRTLLIADLDQAALYGALLRLQSLNLELIELARMPAKVS